ncbi:MAG: MFS transporter [Phenylobacterium sp.]|nr:MFS transporter [Phenylobacterium sp.]
MDEEKRSVSQGRLTSTSGQLSLPAVMAFASASIPIAALVLAITVHLPRYFASHLGLSLAVVGGAFALVRFIDIPLDAGLGLAMDRTRTRFGRYRVWMALGAPVLMFAMYMLMISPQGVGQGYLIGWLLVMYVGYSGVYLSHLAWAGRLAPSYQQRNRVFGAITGLGVVGAMAVLLIPVLMTQYGATDAEGVRAMIWFIIGSTAVTALIVVGTSPEVISKDHETTFGLKDYWSLLTRPNILRLLAADLFVTLGPGWMASMYLFYFTDSRGFTLASANLLLMIYIAAGFAGAPFAAWLANRLSKHRALMVTTTIYSLGLITIPFLPAGNFFIFAPGMFLLGGMAAGFTVLIRAITADIADEIRLESGREWMGLMYAMTTATSKLATAGAIFLTFNVLAAVGYQAQEGATNTPEAITGLELAYIIGPIVFVMIAGACFFGYRLTADRHAEIRRQLDEKDALVDPAAALESLTGEDIAPANRPT